MSDPAFDPFLAEVARALRRPEQSAAVIDELRDHLQERLAELLERGVPRESAIKTALDELGDAAALAAEFNTVSRDLRRRWIMRYASGSLAAAVVLFLVTLAFWPDAPRAPSPPQATAQDKAAPKDTGPAKDAAAPAKPKMPTPEENNARVEAMLIGHRAKAEFTELPLQEFIANLRTIRTIEGKELSLETSLETRRLEEAAVKLDAPITLNRVGMRLDRLIDHVLGRAGIDYYLDDGVMVISSNEDVDTHLEARVYDCRDLMDLPRPKGRAVEPGSSDSSGSVGGDTSLAGAVAAAGGDAEFIRLLVNSVKPDSWQDAGGPGTVAYYRGLLLVSQSDPVHREMNQFLEQFRQAVAKQSLTAKDK